MTSVREQLAAVDSNGNTPLHKAAAGDYVNQVEDHLKNGANPTAKNHDGKIPAELAPAGSESSVILEPVSLGVRILQPLPGGKHGKSP